MIGRRHKYEGTGVAYQGGASSQKAQGHRRGSSTLTLLAASQSYTPVRMIDLYIFNGCSLLYINYTSVRLTFNKKTMREQNWLYFSTTLLFLNHLSSFLYTVLSPCPINSRGTLDPTSTSLSSAEVASVA